MKTRMGTIKNTQELECVEAVSDLRPFVKIEKYEIHYQYNSCDNVEHGIVHDELSFSYIQPEENNKRQYSGSNVKVQKGHDFVESVLDNLTAMLIKQIVVITPIKNVTQDNSPWALGTNAPTTSDANMIFAPSRKKLDITLKSSLGDIQNNFIIRECFVKQNLKVYRVRDERRWTNRYAEV